MEVSQECLDLLAQIHTKLVDLCVLSSDLFFVGLCCLVAALLIFGALLAFVLMGGFKDL